MNNVLNKYCLEGLKNSVKTSSKALVLADKSLPESYVDGVLKSCNSIVPTSILKMTGGEDVKKLERVEEIWHELEKVGADRKSVLICLGGGTITDLGGFAASTYMRGIDLILLPTTVLGMVDASIGGKNGINRVTYKGGGADVDMLKNQMGTFYAPILVGLNLEWLDSLDAKEVKSGWAEMVKHGLLVGGEHLSRLRKIEIINLESIKPLIEDSAKIKEEIVSRDALEKGERASLNLGHTIGHALESCTSDSGGLIRHGEAVAWGLVFTLYASQIKLGFDRKLSEELQKWIIEGIGMHAELVEAERVWAKMKGDKKNVSGNVKDVLLYDIGKVKLGFTWTSKEFTMLWEQFRKAYIRGSS